MIPKVINYCWFGGGRIPKLAKKCIKSWRKHCPDYQIIEWNENNYDLSSAPLYVKQAYQEKKWAFVTDYVRLKVVYDYGGIYLDTDVEIINNIDDLLKYDAFFGFQHDNKINTGLGFGSVKCSKVLFDIMSDYQNIKFIKDDKSLDLLDCPSRNSHVFKEWGFELNGTNQQTDNIALFSVEFFCPMSWIDRKIHITKNTKTIHWYSASWWTREEKKEEKKRRARIIKRKIKRLFDKFRITNRSS